jgi:hypothetical protein
MVKKIIDEHGGSIDIQNRIDGTGAKVLILLLKLAPPAFDHVSSVNVLGERPVQQ